MNWDQTLTIIISVLIPTLSGLAWIICWLRSIDRRLNSLESRVTVVETRMGFIERLLEMAGIPMKHQKQRTDP